MKFQNKLQNGWWNGVFIGVSRVYEKLRQCLCWGRFYYEWWVWWVRFLNLFFRRRHPLIFSDIFHALYTSKKYIIWDVKFFHCVKLEKKESSKITKANLDILDSARLFNLWIFSTLHWPARLLGRLEYANKIKTNNLPSGYIYLDTCWIETKKTFL